MTGTVRPISRLFCILVAGLLGVAPAFSQATVPIGASIIYGTIRDTGGTRIVGVTVLAYHLASGTTIRSSPSDRKGEFRIENLLLGYYDVAVETPDGLFVGNAVVNVRPSGKAILDIVIAPFSVEAPNGDRTFRGTNSSGEGVARVDERLTKGEFWQSPKGIAILAGSGGVLLLLFATSDNSTEVPVSPFQPG